MLQNEQQQQQGLMLEDQQALGMMGFFSNPNSNNLAFLQPHEDEEDHHRHFASSHGLSQPLFRSRPFASTLPPWISSDADAEDDHDHQAASSNNSKDLHQAILISDPGDFLHHQDQDYFSSLMGVPPHLLSLQRSNPPPNPWEWRCSGGECMVSKGSFAGDEDKVVEKKKSLLGISALRMKRMKGRRKVREPRFCFKTLSDVDVLDDGYKWRKYGQKVVKNTHHPRSYYRCTMDKCRVKKRVERLAEDPRMVITTYEGRHVHSPSQDNQDDDSNKAQPILNNFFW